VKSRDFSPDPRTGVKISAFPTPPKDKKLTYRHATFQWNRRHWRASCLLEAGPPAPAADPPAAATPIARHRSSAFLDILPLPLLSRHRLSADLLALLYLHAVDEHADVLADRDQRRRKRNYRLRGTGIDCRSRPCSNGNSTVPAIAIHCSLGTAAQWPSAFRQLPEPS
jgi:hypothetical protein